MAVPSWASILNAPSFELKIDFSLLKLALCVLFLLFTWRPPFDIFTFLAICLLSCADTRGAGLFSSLPPNGLN